MASPEMDMEHLKREPESAFESPKEVVSHEGLSKDEKLEVLTAWEDLVNARDAQPEMRAGDEKQILRQIRDARSELGA